MINITLPPNEKISINGVVLKPPTADFKFKVGDLVDIKFNDVDIHGAKVISAFICDENFKQYVIRHNYHAFRVKDKQLTFTISVWSEDFLSQPKPLTVKADYVISFPPEIDNWSNEWYPA